eukprot:snap_masked-scaffold1462_size40154-processed-gene-0.1 protein:Tk08138 transcript:snap_masked-scaffold1462_size40154-processed-gene-0.1-mRNA-1 annotation:"palmitoyltransferase zdhhc2"
MSASIPTLHEPRGSVARSLCCRGLPMQARWALRDQVASCSVVRVVRWLPVVAILCSKSWSCYTFFLVYRALPEEEGSNHKLTTLVLYHILLGLSIWCFLACIFSNPGVVPDEWNMNRDEVENLSQASSEEEWKTLLLEFAHTKKLECYQLSVQGAMRYCETCHLIKPDRAHHCSVCNQCILRMDHHCPWVNNCIGFYNYKFFILFLVYTYGYCLFLIAFLTVYLFWFRDEKNEVNWNIHISSILVLAIVSFVFISCLLWYHIFLLIVNRTTLEQFRKPILGSGSSGKAWSQGTFRNMQEIFGDIGCLWLLPVFTSMGNGTHYPCPPMQRSRATAHAGRVRKYESVIVIDERSPSVRLDQHFEMTESHEPLVGFSQATSIS